MILAASLACGVASTLAALLIPSYTQLTVPVARMESVSEIVIPFGHWIIVGVWAAIVAMHRTADTRRLIFKCVAVGFASHFVVLVALFVPRLGDREAFSSAAYLRYAQLFCIGVLAGCTAWAIVWMIRGRASLAVNTAIEAPMAAGSIALLIAQIRHDAAMSALAVISGVVMACGYLVLARRPQTATSGIAAVLLSDGAIMAAIFFVALALRLTYIGRIMSDANYIDAAADGRGYDELAWSIASGNGVPRSFSDRYPLLLLGHVWVAAAIYKVVGHSYLALTAVQSVLGAAACVLIFLIARSLFGRWTAVVAATFTAVSFPLMFAAATIGHQALDIFMTALTIFLLVRLARTGGSPLGWASAGAAAGFACTVRETNVFFVAFLPIWIAFANGKGWRRSAPAVTAFAAGVSILVLPFLAPKVGSADDRQRMRQHFDRMYRGEGGSRPSERGDLVGPLEQPKAALTQLATEPRRVIGTLAREYADNFAVQFLTQPYGGFDLVFLRKGSEYYYGMWFYAYALTISGAWLVAKQAWSRGVLASAAFLILGLIVVRTVPHLILASEYRHRAPLEPFLILLASVAVVTVVREAIATAASASTSGFTGSDCRVSVSNGT